MKKKQQILDPKVLANLLKETDPQTLFAPDGLFAQLQKQVVEAVVGAEMDIHMEDNPDPANCRNGYGKKTVSTDRTQFEIDVPRDRKGEFEPQLIEKYRRRLPNFDDSVVSLYATGMSVRDIQEHLTRLYGIDASPSLISRVTEIVAEKFAQWQNRPLERSYCVAIVDAIRIKVRGEDRQVKNKALYVVLGIDSRGHKDILGLWLFESEGAKNWLRIFNDLKARGVEDFNFIVMDGLKGLSEVAEDAFPEAIVQTCIVHMQRHCLSYASHKDRKQLAAMLKGIYQSVDAEDAERKLAEFENSELGRKYPMIGKIWRNNWEKVIPFFAFSPVVRRLLYTTNAVESVNSVIRRSARKRGHFPNDQAALKGVFLALQGLLRKWDNARAVPGWDDAKIEFAIMFGDRFQPAS